MSATEESASADARDTGDTPATEPSVEPFPPAQRSDRTAQKRSRGIRLGVLTAILVLITGIGILHQTGTSFKPVGVDALCPFGGIETLWSLMSGAGLMRRIAVSSVVLLATTFLIAIVFRRAFCGYLCPLGVLQELFGKIGTAIWPKNRPVMSAAIDKTARLLKYGVLVFFTVWTWQAATLVIRPYDPWVAWMHLTSAELFAEFGVGVAILGISLVGSIVYDRFFCKYLCPMGAFLGAISRFSLFKVRRVESTCIDCKLCDRACPVNVTVSTVDVVQDAECINCNECVNACPVADTLVVSTSTGNGTATAFGASQMMWLVFALAAIMIGVTTVSGAFAWTMPTLSSAVEQTGGTLNVEDIKGSMTFAEVSAASGIPTAVFMQQYGISDADLNAKIKDLVPIYGFDVHTDVREFVAAQMAAGAGAPAGGSEGTAPACGMGGEEAGSD